MIRSKLHMVAASIALLFAVTAMSLGIADAAHHTAGTKVVTKVVKMVNTEGGSYAFSPKTITIKVGQRITWKNVSNTAHTATANNFSWSTPTVQRHHSASHKFKKAGTFKYTCQFHAFMHGVIKVVKK